MTVNSIAVVDHQDRPKGAAVVSELTFQPIIATWLVPNQQQGKTSEVWKTCDLRKQEMPTETIRVLGSLQVLEGNTNGWYCAQSIVGSTVGYMT